MLEFMIKISGFQKSISADELNPSEIPISEIIHEDDFPLLYQPVKV